MLEPVFVSNRLQFVRLVPDHAVELFQLHSIPKVVEYVGMPIWVDVSEALDYILSCEESYLKNGFGYWAVYLLDTNALVGIAGLTQAAEKSTVELGFRFYPQFWGQGIATESVKAIIDYSFKAFKIELVYALVRSENIASKKVLLNAAFKSCGVADCRGLEANKFVIERKDLLL